MRDQHLERFGATEWLQLAAAIALLIGTLVLSIKVDSLSPTARHVFMGCYASLGLLVLRDAFSRDEASASEIVYDAAMLAFGFSSIFFRGSWFQGVASILFVATLIVRRAGLRGARRVEND